MTTPRLLEVAERHADQFGDQRPEGVPLRRRLAHALSDRAAHGSGPRIAAILKRMAGASEPVGGRNRERARRARPRIRDGADGALRWRRRHRLDRGRRRAHWQLFPQRDALVPFLTAARGLSAANRERLLAAVETYIRRDDAVAATLARTEGLAPPSQPAPSAEACRRAVGLPEVRTAARLGSGVRCGVAASGEIERRLDEARALVDTDERAARLFVVASQLATSDDARQVAEGRAVLEEAALAGSSHAALELGLMLAAGRRRGGCGGGCRVDDARRSRGWRRRRCCSAGRSSPSSRARRTGSPGCARRRRRRSGMRSGCSAWAYLRGLGVARDAAQARVMLQAAAQHEVVEAQVELAALFADGIGGARDEAAAAAWNKRAAESVAIRSAAGASPSGRWRSRAAWRARCRGSSAPPAPAAVRRRRAWRGCMPTGATYPADADAAARWRARAVELGYSER